MPKVTFNEPVYFEGKSYEKGESYTLSTEEAKALGNSVKIEGKSKEDSNESGKETKEVEGPTVNKMVAKPVTKK